MGYSSSMTDEDGMDELETDDIQQPDVDYRRRLDFRNSVHDECGESETSEVTLSTSILDILVQGVTQNMKLGRRLENF